MNATTALSFAADPLNYKTGYLIKQGGHIKTWRRRFFVLDKRLQTLSYFRRETSVKPKGMIPLQGYVVSHAENETKLSYSFQIKKKNCRTYFFLANDEDNRQNWMQALEESNYDNHDGDRGLEAFKDDDIYMDVQRWQDSDDDDENDDYDDEDTRQIIPDSSIDS